MSRGSKPKQLFDTVDGNILTLVFYSLNKLYPEIKRILEYCVHAFQYKQGDTDCHCREGKF
jgi:hypothetical protein